MTEKEQKENLFNKIFNFLKSKKNNKKEELNNTKSNKIIDNIISEIDKQDTFSFNKENLDKILKAEKFIKELYLFLSDYIISWEFLDTDVNKILSKITEYRDNLNEINDTSDDEYNSKEFLKFDDNLQSLFHDLRVLQDLKNEIWFKRKKDIIKIFSNDNIWNNRTSERKIFILLLELINIQISIWDDLNNSILEFLIHLYESVLKINNKLHQKYIKFIKDTIILDLFKISLVSWKNKFDYYNEWEIKTLNIEKYIKDTIYKEYINELRFISWKKTNNNFIKKYIRNFKENKISSLSIYVLLKNYKDINRSGKKLKNIYDLFTYDIKEEKDDIKLNQIFIWNHYLSYLIEKYNKTGDEKLVFKIDEFYKEIINLSKELSNKWYENYFSYYKYAHFKNIEYNKKFLWKIKSYKYLNWIIDTAEKSIEKAIKLFKDIDYHSYYEFDKKDFFINYEWEYIYCHNLFLFPFDRDKKYRLLEIELDKVRENKIDIKYKENFWKISESLEKNKLEAMAIIWIFTWIVVYSIWTIQIFSVIEDIWSAIMFAWIFLSGLLILVWGVFFKEWYGFKYNKGLQLIVLSLVILFLSFLGKYYFSENKWILNWNRWQLIYSKLEWKIIEWENIKDYIDEKIKKYEKINKELKEKLNKIEKYNKNN